MTTSPLQAVRAVADLLGLSLQLPNGWLWDMVDEFVYQFQSWQQYRGKLSSKGAEELEALRSCEHMWSILSVLNYLQALADKSGIAKELSTVGAAPPTAPQGLESCGWQ